MTVDTKGRELFIVDNSISGWSGLRYLEEWTGIAKAFEDREARGVKVLGVITNRAVVRGTAESMTRRLQNVTRPLPCDTARRSILVIAPRVVEWLLPYQRPVNHGLCSVPLACATGKVVEPSPFYFTCHPFRW